jgi:Cu-Zn family superoxide dismutase
MRRAHWLIAPMVGTLLAGATLTAAADGPRATGQLIDRAGAPVGRVDLEQIDAGVRLTVEASGLTPGQHGIHVHAVGKCEAAAFTTAAGHFNPASKKHGLKNPEGAHGGDLPNLTADANGRARFTATTNLVTLAAGPTSVFDADGAAVVIHAGPDDEMTDPAGNSGDRVACAVLSATATMPRTGDGGMAPTEPAPFLAASGLLALLGAAGFLRRRRNSAG